MSRKLPFVFINVAMTADGKIATASRAVSSFGSQRDFEHLLELRSDADAVMAGARTVDSKPVNLGPGPAPFRRLRLKKGLAEHNLRVIVSGSGSIDPQARIFRERFSPIIILTTARTAKRKLKQLQSLADEVKICGRQEINFTRALAWLRETWKVRRLLCEGGGELNEALFRAGVVRELHLTICPKIFAGRAAPTLAGGLGVARLAEATPLRLKSMKRVGNELFLRYEVVRRRRTDRS